MNLRLVIALLLGLIGICLVAAGLAIGADVWVAMIFVGAVCMTIAGLMDYPSGKGPKT